MDMDIAKFFDTVDHKCLMECLKQQIADPSLLRIIARFCAIFDFLGFTHFCDKTRGKGGEAIDQGGVLTQEDLAILLGTSLSTIKRDDAYLMKQDVSLLTRGMVEDIGRGVSHKTKAVELYLKNYTLSEIARKMAHSPSSVNRYLEDFLVVAFLHRESYPLLTIRKITKLSERLIKEYISLIERAESEGYKDRFNQLLDQFKVNEPFKKTLEEGAQ